MSRLSRYVRSIRAIFNSDYKPIDTKNHLYEGKPYDVRSQKFFEIARAYQIKNGLTQKQAVNIIHDTFVVKDAIEGKKTSQSKEVQEIVSHWFDEQMEFDTGIEYIYDVYEG